MGNFGILLPPKLFLRISMLLFLAVHNANSQYVDASRRLKPCELESLLRDLTYPEEGYEMHAAALRNQLRHILERDPTDGGYQSLDEYGSYDNSGPYEDKRSYRSLLREGKRNLGSLARAGLLRAPSSDYLKRSIATLAKNGQLPASREPDSSEASTAGGWTDEKRNLASARASGYMLNGKRNIASLARKYELPGKRNIQSLLRTGMLPSIAPKRNMQSLARDNSIPHYAGPQESKRNIQTLVRDWNLPRQQSMASENEKRNIQALKNSQGHGGDSSSGGRKKRELYYDDEALDDSTPEILEPVYQSAPLDYEELMEAMNEAYPAPYYNPGDNHLEEKRYLGSLARAGILNRYHRFNKRVPLGSLDDSFDDDNDDDDGDDADDNEGEHSHEHEPSASDGAGDDNDEDYEPENPAVLRSPHKRHIASIVRSGWMPSFRPSRTAGRFSRSGRARSQIVEFYSQPERLRQPIAGVCRRCDGTSDSSGFRTAAAASSPFGSWGAPGLQSTSTWGSTPPRVTALHWRHFREPSATVRRRTARGVPLLRWRFQ
ncbi:neuropeptide-like precursor 1 isoform X1 [Ochlerotatus camptorhynchus]|uniref:neuropeptide-like precursor 1 isoform X1 n=1 Tax=Ochlerotatus camptorhynchus TaxID=644619 RepID=UPI0031E1083B